MAAAGIPTLSLFFSPQSYF